MPERRLQRTRAAYDARPDPGPLTDNELVAVFRERYITPIGKQPPSERLVIRFVKDFDITVDQSPKRYDCYAPLSLLDEQ